MPTLVLDQALDYCLVSIEGVDAASFLQAQLCNDVKGLCHGVGPAPPLVDPIGPAQSQLSGYCNAKGRLYATFLIWQLSPEAFHLLLPGSLAPLLVKRLSLFVLRAKVKLRQTQRPVYGVIGPVNPNEQTLSNQDVSLLEADRPGLAETSAVTERRYWLIGPDPETKTNTAVDNMRTEELAGASLLPAQQASTQQVACVLPEGFVQLSPAQWVERELRQGLPWFQAELTERFVPQMVNLDLLGGVSFTKGCYPGQEVVARSHYLGKLNQRMFLFEGPAGLTPGSDVFLTTAAPSQPGHEQAETKVSEEAPIGEIIASALCNSTDHSATSGSEPFALYLISLKLEPFRGQTQVAALQASSGQPVQLTLQALPYDVPREPQVPNRPKL
jgi:folate-binding protein YgfZ